MVVDVPPEEGPEVTLSETTVGTATLLTKVNPAALVAVWLSELVNTTSTVPATCAGV